MHLTEWKARRAGGRITINGTGDDGTPRKIVGVDVIEPSHLGSKDYVVAIDKTGAKHTLAV